MWKSFRWLLLVILPILGLIAGWKLQPAQKPVWTYQAEYVVKPLGYVNNNSTLLVAEVTSQGKQSLFGVEPETGLEQFRIPITRELLDASAVQIRECVLSDDERYVVFPASHYDEKKSKEKQVILLDWKAGKVEKRFWVERMVKNVFLKNNTLVARDERRITIWDIQKPERSQCIEARRMDELHFDLSTEMHFNLDPNARFAYRNFVVFVENSDPVIANKLILFDIRKGTFLPVLDGYYSDVEWSSDGQSFTALQSVFTNLLMGQLTLHYFVRTEEGFKDVPEKRVTIASQGIRWTVVDKNFRVLHSNSRLDRRRLWLYEKFDSRIIQLVTNIWPESESLLLYDRKTNRFRGSITGLDGAKISSISYALSLPEIHGLVIGNERYFEYWNYNPISNWYPLFGLLCGVLLSALLIWMTRRRRIPNLSAAQLS